MAVIITISVIIECIELLNAKSVNDAKTNFSQWVKTVLFRTNIYLQDSSFMMYLSLTPSS